MLTSLIVRIIDVCTRNAWRVVAVGLALALASGVYVARHFAINSDINALLSSDLSWRKRVRAGVQTFREDHRRRPGTDAGADGRGDRRADAGAGEEQESIPRGHAIRRRRGFRQQWAPVPVAGGSRAQPRAAGPGGTAHPRSRDRSELTRARQRAGGRPARDTVPSHQPR